MASNDPRMSKAERREEAREAALRMRAEQERKAKRRRTNIAVWSTVSVVALVVLIVVIVVQGNKPEVVNTPTVATANGGIPVTAQGVSAADPNLVTMEVYSDYMCPVCSRFEEANAAQLDTYVKAGKINLVQHPISILDQASAGTNYSTRAASAAATIAEKDPTHFEAFHEAMFKNQPQENTTGLTDDQIKAIALGVGVPEDVANSLAEGKYKTWVTQSTQDAFKRGVGGTPTVYIDGTEIKDRNPEGIKTALDAAIAAKAPVTPAPTATISK